MKKLVVLAVLVVAVTGFAAAGGMVFQLGAGYHSSYVGDITDMPAELVGMNMPLGVGGYAGVGYGFGEKKMISLGVEFAPSWDLSVSPFGVSNFGYQARGFLKFKPAGLLTVTGFGGYAGSGWYGSDISNWQANGNLVFGGRLTVLFIYAEYGAVVPFDFSGITKHEIGLGFAFFK